MHYYRMNPDNLNALWQALFDWFFTLLSSRGVFVLIHVATHCMLLWLKLCGLSCNIFNVPKIIIKEFKSQIRSLFKKENLKIYTKINSLYVIMGGYVTIPDHRKSNSLSTRALSNFSLCLFTIGLYCDGHNLMCYFKL